LFFRYLEKPAPTGKSKTGEGVAGSNPLTSSKENLKKQNKATQIFTRRDIQRPNQQI
jgi:hypothetical protein